MRSKSEINNKEIEEKRSEINIKENIIMTNPKKEEIFNKMT